MKHLLQAEYDDLLRRAAEGDRLTALINTPELVDFAKAVHLEAVHEEERWGTDDREGKEPYDWHWLVAHLSGRSLAHHKEAERLEVELRTAQACGSVFTQEALAFCEAQIAHHREKAVHHTITAGAALAHWHASILGKHTGMQPGSADGAKAAKRLEGAGA